MATHSFFNESPATMVTHAFDLDCPSGNRPAASDEVVEVPFLLPTWQVDALESAAHARGVSTAALLRQVLTRFLRSTGEVGDAPSSKLRSR